MSYAAMRLTGSIIAPSFSLTLHISHYQDNYTALHVAVEYCKPQAIQTLLGNGAQVEIKGGPNRETPLHIAARIKDGDRCAEMLMKSGANVNSTQEVVCDVLVTYSLSCVELCLEFAFN